MASKRSVFVFILSLLFLLLIGLENYPGELNKFDNTLFRIGRSRDANEIIYDLNFDNKGKLVAEDLINIYWIKRTDNNRKEPLTRIQKRFAYGLRFLDENKDDNIRFRFVSYDDRTFVLKRNNLNLYRVYTISKNKQIIVERIFVRIDGGTFWIPDISRVELHGKEIRTGKKVLEIINP